jgi:hypothetical protein
MDYSTMKRADFIREYALSIDRLMETKATKLDLPADFLAKWGEQEKREPKPHIPCFGEDHSKCFEQNSIVSGSVVILPAEKTNE